MHKQAALNTLKFMGTAFLVGVFSGLAINFLSLGQLITLVCVGFFGWTVYMVYLIEKARLELHEKLALKDEK